MVGGSIRLSDSMTAVAVVLQNITLKASYTGNLGISIHRQNIDYDVEYNGHQKCVSSLWIEKGIEADYMHNK
jgi:hypothetical protein